MPAESDLPYSEFFPERPPPIDGRPFTIDGLWSASYRTFRYQWAPCIFNGLLIYLVLPLIIASTLALLFLPKILAEDTERSRELTEWQSLGMQIALVVSWPAIVLPTIAAVTVYLSGRASGEPTRLLAVLGRTILTLPKLMVLAIPVIVVFTMGFLIGGALPAIAELAGHITGPIGSLLTRVGSTLLLVAITIAFIIRTFVALPILIDRQATTIIGAFHLGLRATRPYDDLGRLLGVVVLAYLASIASVFVFGIGFVLIGIPLAAATLGAVYAMFKRDRIEPLLTGQPDSQSSSNDIP